MASAVKKEILDLFKSDGVLLEKVATVTGRDFGTVLRYAKPFDKKLLNYDTLKVISEHTGKPIEDITEDLVEQQDEPELQNVA